MLLKQMLLVGGALIFIFAGIFCTERNPGISGGAEENQFMSVEDALVKYSSELLALPGVTGVGQGRCQGQPCIKVYVESCAPELKKQIGNLLKDHRFEIQQSGKFKARPKNP